MILKLSLELPEDRAYVGMTRTLSRCALEYLKVATEVTDDIEFIVGELATNVVYHAHGERYRVDLEYHGDRVVVLVTDCGKGFSFQEVPPPGTERLDPVTGGAADRIGGFGLVLVKAMSDHLAFFRADSQGTTVRAEKKLRFQSEGAAQHAADLAGSNEGGGATATLHQG